MAISLSIVRKPHNNGYQSLYLVQKILLPRIIDLHTAYRLHQTRIINVTIGFLAPLCHLAAELFKC